MKNFELHIDQIASDWAESGALCFIADFYKDGQCPDLQLSCNECFRQWALQEQSGGEQDERQKIKTDQAAGVRG